MTAFNKLMDIFSLTPDEDDDDDYDDDYDLDDYDDEEDEGPSRWEIRRAQAAEAKAARKEEKERARREEAEERALDREEKRREKEARNAEKLQASGKRSDQDRLDRLEQERVERERAAEAKTRSQAATRPVGSSHQAQKITPVGGKSKGRGSVEMDIRVIRPTDILDEREITDTLLEGRTVLLVMEGLDIQLAQRIIDFTGGSTYAIGGNMQKISNYIFLATPNGVDISGDINSSILEKYDSNPYNV